VIYYCIIFDIIPSELYLQGDAEQPSASLTSGFRAGVRSVLHPSMDAQGDAERLLACSGVRGRGERLTAPFEEPEST
jgi:hypothetical protein